MSGRMLEWCRKKAKIRKLWPKKTSLSVISIVVFVVKASCWLFPGLICMYREKRDEDVIYVSSGIVG